MLKCSKCELYFPDFSRLSPHLLNYHQSLRSDQFLCGQPGALCEKRLFCFSALKVHFENKHNIQDPIVEINENIDDAVPFELNVNLNDIPDVEGNVADNEEADFNVGAGDNLDNAENLNFRYSLANFINNLYSNIQLYAAQLYSIPNTSRKLVDLILSATSCLFSGSMALLKDIVFNVLSKFDVFYNEYADDVRKLEEIFEVLMNPMDSMETEYQRVKTFSERGTFIAPQSFHLGSVNKYVRGRDLTVALIQKPVSNYVVPLRNVLKVFLELPGIFHLIVNYMQAVETAPAGKLFNVLQGSLWRNVKQSFGEKIVLPLKICFDDYEPDNTLGSHSGDHSLGALYAELACLPEHMASSLDNMFTFAMFESKYRKKFGNTITFRQVIEELTFLHDEGIILVINNCQVHVYFCLVAIIGDNKGVNEILGFIACFRGNFFCRICKLHRDVMSHWCYPVPLGSLRTLDNYILDVGVNDYSLTGIKENCVFNDVPSYNCIDFPYCDEAHDILEGMLKYDLCNLLYYFIARRDYFTLETLCERVAGFNYGPSDVGNKPPSEHFTIEKFRDCSLNLSATEWLCLGRYLGLMIGDLIPEPPNDLFAPNAWRLYLNLHEILMIVVSPVVDAGKHVYLSALVQAHHELYMQFFGPIKPKHHMMIHYPKLLELYGPLPPLSSLKSERNHRRGKIYAHSCHSRVDFAYSTIVKHQLMLCERLLRVDNGPELKYTKLTRVRVHSLIYHELFAHIMPNPFDHVQIVNTATILGTLYSVKMVLVLNVHDLLPEFGKILYIMLHNDTVAFVIRKLHTVDYRDHICSYIVEETNDFSFQQHNELMFHVPLWERISSDDGRHVVCLKHVL